MTTAKVLNERRHVIEAMVVRLMKSSKSMKHQNLVNGVIKELNLPLTVRSTLSAFLDD